MQNYILGGSKIWVVLTQIVGFSHDVIDLSLIIARPTDYHRSRYVRAIALHLRAEVQQQKIPVANFGRRRTGVGKCRTRTGRNDGGKWEAFATLVAKRALEDPGDLQLRHADTNFSQRALERADGHRRRALDEPDLVRVFALAQRFDEVERRPPLPARARFHQPLKVSMQKMSRLEPYDLNARGLRQLLPQSGPQALLLDRDAGDVTDFVRSLDLIAEVGDEDRVTLAHQQQSARAGKAGEIANVGETRDEECIHVRCR